MGGDTPLFDPGETEQLSSSQRQGDHFELLVHRLLIEMFGACIRHPNGPCKSPDFFVPSVNIPIEAKSHGKVTRKIVRGIDPDYMIVAHNFTSTVLAEYRDRLILVTGAPGKERLVFLSEAVEQFPGFE